MLHPILGRCEGTGCQLACQIGDQLDARRRIGDGAGDSGEISQHRLHQRRVKRMGDGQGGGFYTGSFQRGSHCVDCFSPARDDDILGRVDGCNRNVSGIGSYGVAHLFHIGGDGQHGAACRQCAHQPSARRNQVEALFQGKDAGNTSCHIFPNAMSHHQIGLNAPSQPKLCQGIFQRKECRLCIGGVVDLGQLGVVDARIKYFQEWGFQMGAQQFVAAIQGRAKNRFGCIELPTHLAVLGALSGKKKGNFRAEPCSAFSGPNLTFDDAGGVTGLPGCQLFLGRLWGGCHHTEAVGMVVASNMAGKGHIGQIVGWPLLQKCDIPICQCL